MFERTGALLAVLLALFMVVSTGEVALAESAEPVEADEEELVTAITIGILEDEARYFAEAELDPDIWEGLEYFYVQLLDEEGNLLQENDLSGDWFDEFNDQNQDVLTIPFGPSDAYDYEASDSWDSDGWLEHPMVVPDSVVIRVAHEDEETAYWDDGLHYDGYDSFEEKVEALWDNLPAPDKVWVDASWDGLDEYEEIDGRYFGYDAFATIGDALANTAEDGTINVFPGTYTETITVDVPGLTLQAVDEDGDAINAAGHDDSPPVVIDADGEDIAVLVQRELGDVTVQGFAVGNWAFGGVVQPMSESEGTSTHVIANLIMAPEEGPTAHGNSIQVSGDGSTVMGNEVEVTGYHEDTAPSDDSPTGILVIGAEGVLVEGNHVYFVEGGDEDEDHSGIAVGGHQGHGWGVSSGNLVLNNTVEGLHRGIVAWGDAHDTLIDGNTAADNVVGIQSSTRAEDAVPSGTVINYNVIVGNEMGVEVAAEEDVDAEEEVDATYNWWGHETGPYHPERNEDGEGDPVSDNVLFDPWLETEGLPSTYEFDYEVPEDIEAGEEVEVPVTFQTDELGEYGYEGVRFHIEADGPGEVAFTAEDSQGDEYTFTDEGYWGPESGFDLPAYYNETTDWTLLFAEDGEYTITFSLIDAETEEVIAGIQDSVTVEVGEMPDVGELLIDVRPDSINANSRGVFMVSVRREDGARLTGSDFAVSIGPLDALRVQHAAFRLIAHFSRQELVDQLEGDGTHTLDVTVKIEGVEHESKAEVHVFEPGRPDPPGQQGDDAEDESEKDTDDEWVPPGLRGKDDDHPGRGPR